jgi:hypothetical protein
MSGTHPAATDIDAVDDTDWFAGHPGRAYRLRRGYEGWWIVERRPGGELLRTWTATITPNLPDTDAALARGLAGCGVPTTVTRGGMLQRLYLSLE